MGLITPKRGTAPYRLRHSRLLNLDQGECGREHQAEEATERMDAPVRQATLSGFQSPYAYASLLNHAATPEE
jgi:hypothetical protein